MIDEKVILSKWHSLRTPIKILSVLLGIGYPLGLVSVAILPIPKDVATPIAIFILFLPFSIFFFLLICNTIADLVNLFLRELHWGWKSFCLVLPLLAFLFIEFIVNVFFPSVEVEQIGEKKAK